jgi:hypothetical protein
VGETEKILLGVVLGLLLGFLMTISMQGGDGHVCRCRHHKDGPDGDGRHPI